MYPRLFLTTFLVVNAAFLSFSFSHASPISQNLIVTDVLHVADTQNLYVDQQWLKLLHFDKGLIGIKKKSLVKTEGFFLASSGYKDARAEMQATIKAFFLPIKKADANNHALCRFPARYQWLSQRIPLLNALSGSRSLCTDYYDWIHKGKVDSVSLFFANGFFENPASFFGHSLLRFNVSASEKSDNLLSTSIDYGAIIPKGEHPVVYILKGVFGGYEAGFSDGNFYRHNYDYGESQLRDLWEYKLNLTASQRSLILDHTWELMPNKFTYYFTYRNCGSAMADMMELVFPDVEFYDRQKLWVMPVELFDQMHKKNKELNIYSGLVFHPSRQTRFRENYKGLSDVERKAFLLRVNGDNTRYIALDEYSQRAVLTVLLDYYQLLISKEYNIEESKNKKHQALVDRIKLPAGRVYLHDGSFPHEKAPHLASPPSLLQISAGVKNDRNQYLVRYRPVQFDFLGLEIARPKNSNLTVLDTTFEIYDDELALKNVDFLKILSINDSVTGLPGDRPISWGMKLSYGQKNLDCSRCDNFSVKADVGKAVRVADYFVAYSMFGVIAQSEVMGQSPISVVPSVGAVFDFGDLVKANVTYAKEFNGSENTERFGVEGRYQLSERVDFRFQANKNVGKEMFLGVSFYW